MKKNLYFKTTKGESMLSLPLLSSQKLPNNGLEHPIKYSTDLNLFSHVYIIMNSRLINLFL